ncbi:MAG: response regulator transcription factor [Chloroflexi bacterium]|nr:response regulator transcription factor [Chloroflexota bacterium]
MKVCPVCGSKFDAMVPHQTYFASKCRVRAFWRWRRPRILDISDRTVGKHVDNLLAKMGAASRLEAGVRAVRDGLVAYLLLYVGLRIAYASLWWRFG